MNADPKLIGDPVRIEGPNLATLLRPSDFRHEATRDFRSGAVSFGRVDGLGTWLKGRSGQVVEQFEIQDCHFAGPRVPQPDDEPDLFDDWKMKEAAN